MASFIEPLLDQWGQGATEFISPYGNAGTGENDVPATASITHNWTNPGNVISQLGASTANLASSGDPPFILPYLRASNFGFNVPSTATVVGIEVQIVWGFSSGTTYTEDEIRLAWGASAVNLSTTNNADLAAIPTTVDTTELKGSPTDLWGELASTLTPTVLNSSDFGWVIKLGRLLGTSNRIAHIDCMRARIYYTVPEPLAGNARVTQTEALVLVTEMKDARVTQAYAEALVAVGAPVTFPPGRRQATILISS